MKNRTWKQQVKSILPTKGEFVIFLPWMVLASFIDAYAPALEDQFFLTLLVYYLAGLAGGFSILFIDKEAKHEYDKGYDNGYCDGEHDGQNLSKDE